MNNSICIFGRVAPTTIYIDKRPKSIVAKTPVASRRETRLSSGVRRKI
ncbi:hypothetical protein M7I_5172 [Glarea lozoyensis 74030]|uniref:Uncharacterized protein n=1 Tax=Glarea lozoyensis (strain ATCC 74030 / MF5533) TaxID=1104152 RepID=H0ER56_GLAL7|nr:hypothetical protein M7I_5172 [Glarea lozoyensis 74030]